MSGGARLGQQEDAAEGQRDADGFRPAPALADQHDADQEQDDDAGVVDGDGVSEIRRFGVGDELRRIADHSAGDNGDDEVNVGNANLER